MCRLTIRLVALSFSACTILVRGLSPTHGGPSDDVVSRRSLLVGGTAASTSLLFSSPIKPAYSVDVGSAPSQILVPGTGNAKLSPVVIGSWDDRQPLQTKLGRTRITAQELSPLQTFSLGIGDPQELFYPTFLFGEWAATATLKQKVYPYGPAFLPSKSLLEGSPRNRQETVGNTCTYDVRYFSTLANTLSNKLTVNLGTGVPESKIIQDRAFNAISISNAYKQLATVQDVVWDYRSNPTKLTLNFGAGIMTDDMRPLGPRRTEIFINARQSESISGDDGNPSSYCAAERSRSVTLAPGATIVSDTETITEFTKVADNHVTAVSRIAVYLTPNPNNREGILWEQVGGKAVAFFDYSLDMTRKLENFQLSDGSTVSRACVETPKNVVQCE